MSTSIPVVNLTATALQLYSGDPLRSQAAEEISDRMTYVIKDTAAYMAENPEYDEAKLAKILGGAYILVEEVMTKFGKQGACDSEPRYVVQQTLIDYVKDYYGIEGFTDLADYM